MFGLRGLVYLALSAFTVLFGAAWGRRIADARKHGSPDDPATDARLPTAGQNAIGAVTNFFDFLGIGSFATTTSIFRILKMVPDRLIPGTLLVGHSFPTFAQSFVSVTIIPVEMTTLVLLVCSAVVGSWLGAGVVSKWPKRRVQIGMGVALLGAAAVMAVRLLALVPEGGELGLSETKLIIGMAANFILGALMTIGIGAYAPSLIVFGFLGMDTKAIFPVMMTSCAFLMPVGGFQFVRRSTYHLRASLGLTIGGIPAVFAAAYLVKELPLLVLKWVVLVVVVYTALAMLRAAHIDKKAQATREAT